MASDASRWSEERVREREAERGWRVGCNFTPSTASNQLEMWAEDTFDPVTIELELGWAASLGFTSVRIFLHDLFWQHDREGLIDRLDRFLEIADVHGISALVVLFDGVWDPHPRWGPQADPRPGIHNSRWVQSPGAEILDDPARYAELAPYVQGVLSRYSDDRRIDGWDLFNEPDNPNPAYAKSEITAKDERAVALLRRAFDWAREVNPSQPLTAGVWRGSWSDPSKLSPMDRLCLDESDVISFHHYGELAALEHRVDTLRRYERPIWCTEWLARSMGSCFDPHLAWMKEHGVGAYCWGLVAGRTQTHQPWETWVKPSADEPDPWHHEILRKDGTPYDDEEV